MSTSTRALHSPTPPQPPPKTGGPSSTASPRPASTPHPFQSSSPYASHPDYPHEATRFAAPSADVHENYPGSAYERQSAFHETAYARDPANAHAPPVPPPPPTRRQASADHARFEAGGVSTEAERSGWSSHGDGQDDGRKRQREELRARLPAEDEGWAPPGAGLEGMSKPDLTHLLSTPALLTALLHHPTHMHPALAQSTAQLQAALQTTQTLAQQTAQMETHLVAVRDKTAQHLLTVRALEQTWRRKQKDMEARLEEYGPRVLHQRLVGSIAEQEGVCRAVEEGWIEDAGGDGKASERETAEWVRRVREGRRVVALRRERRARWDEGRVGGWR